jgi:hypothetical protein
MKGLVTKRKFRKTTKEQGSVVRILSGKSQSDEDGVLQAEGRKQVSVIYFQSLKELKEYRIRALLFEASMIDHIFGLKKKIRRRNNAFIRSILTLVHPCSVIAHF